MGQSRTGKTPLSARIAAALEMTHIQASEWVKKRFDGTPYTDRNAYVQAITRFSIEELQREPYACVAYIDHRNDLRRDCVVEGIRNPHDFVHLFDPRADVAVLLNHVGNPVTRTAFESGLDVIAEYLRFLDRTGVMAPTVPPRVREVTFRAFYPQEREGLPNPPDGVFATFDEMADDVIQALRRMPRTRSTAIAPMQGLLGTGVHVEIAPMACTVQEEFLYDMDPAHVGKTVACTAFALSSYPGSTPTFKILLQNGAVFSYIPPHALQTSSLSPDAVTLDLADLASINCPSEPISVKTFAALAGRVQAYFKRKDLWLEGSYVLTVDWTDSNDLLHLIALENGQLAFVPQHKVVFGNAARELPQYRKLRQVWRVLKS